MLLQLAVLQDHYYLSTLQVLLTIIYIRNHFAKVIKSMRQQDLGLEQGKDILQKLFQLVYKRQVVHIYLKALVVIV